MAKDQLGRRGRAHHVSEHGHVPMLDDPDTILRYIDATVTAAPWLPDEHDSWGRRSSRRRSTTA
ncbi:hypothetical protein AB0I35_22965 [Nocardia sp. NPDC050378]|uniref:hypothetical protein n=1 Tax=Nocardia sp. NPDC050378 TaxID=3155400 RepID=UPI00340AB054